MPITKTSVPVVGVSSVNTIKPKEIKKSATPAATTTTPNLKKDGTADKRFKNAPATNAAGPLKKDGTPDMRYKSNKKK